MDATSQVFTLEEDKREDGSINCIILCFYRQSYKYTVAIIRNGYLRRVTGLPSLCNGLHVAIAAGRKIRERRVERDKGTNPTE